MRESDMQQMIEQLQRELEKAESDRVDVGDMKLPLDEGLVVTVQSVPADKFEESHTHVFPELDAIEMHLVPPEAQEFDRDMTNFCTENDL